MYKNTNEEYTKITEFFLKYFGEIKSDEDINNHFGSIITDVTNEKKYLDPNLILEESIYEGLKHFDFIFHGKNSYFGELSLDFINSKLKNVRCQLFANGFIANIFGLEKQYKIIQNLVSSKYGNPFKVDFGKITGKGVITIGWTDQKKAWFITLRKGKNQPGIRNYISFCMEEMTNEIK